MGTAPGAQRLRRLRHKAELSQTLFWGRIGVSQQRGSRYETGAEMTKDVTLLVELAYGCIPLFTLAKLRDMQLDDFMREQGFVRKEK
ncbi:helix-turn-helix transcriptional regulator [Cupriavidus sp. UYPR2.512]|uniref:helix-turn-helix domain-containing protein n=1 Tax=Cupriavidus sp. UYPR2.512 TaxID=1080187 RepID=UPI00047769F6|nr:helix-turn-helix transcriptional regulator [Cupriavidus sp. UYPR2.512]UIF90904.1 helix-turn-helix domain-containing protein [Cupriavidus necator]